MVAELTEKDFDSEVLKSKLPVIIDFWASWCVAPNSAVLKTRYDSDSAASIRKSDKILAYDGHRVLEAGVLDSRTTISGGHCKKIVTNLGRALEVTDDHLFYTSMGWKKANSLKKADKVAVYPVFFDGATKNKNKAQTIMEKEDIQKHAELGIRVAEHIGRLEKLNLIPLKTDNPKIHTIARIIGALFSDGSLYRSQPNNYSEASFALGRNEDVGELVSDLRSLGFESSVRERKNTFRINKRKTVINSKRVKVSSTAFWLLMQALGVPNGRKTDAKYTLPRWILNSPKAIKREFLSGYLGGDGPALSIRITSRGKRGAYNHLNINDIELYKKEESLRSGIIFARQLASLLKEVGIEVSRIFVDKERNKRSYGGYSKSIHIALSSSFETGLAMAAVGYAYCHEKQIQANYVGSFLKKKIEERLRWKNKYQKAAVLFSQGRAINEVATDLGVNYNTAFGWLRQHKKPTINYTFERYDKWLRETTEGLKDGLVWENIEEIKEIYLPKVQSLTIDKYSNFIANGFLVHNCGPCRVFSPIIEEVSKGYDGKAKFFKLNTDENAKIAEKYNIMSIPSVLLFEEGEVKAMSIGAIPKEEFKRWVDSNL